MRTRKVYDCPINGDLVTLEVGVRRVKCSDRRCMYSRTYKPDFEDENHRITKKLRSYIEFLLLQNLNLKAISIMTGVSKNVVKDIDKERLNYLYTDDGKTLKKPTTYSRRLAVDEFLLHKGHKYATVIIDLHTGHILHLSHGKKKACVTEFINRVGLKWMSHVEAVACDMNSDFEEAFKEQCPHLSIVFDRFHIVKNFNEKVIANIRKDEQRRLKDLGDDEGAKLLKDSKYKLIANEATRKLHDVEADQGKVIKKESKLFNGREYKRKGGECEHYNKIIKENELFFIVDYVKELLKYAYTVDTRNEMESVLGDIVELCVDSKNKHMYWFAKLIVNHIEGIVSYADHKINTGKLEGMNNKIKTIRRKAYGYNDDEYFFLKLFDASRN